MTDVSMLEARIQALEARVDALASGSTSSGGDGVGDGVGFVASGLGQPPLVPIGDGIGGGAFAWDPETRTIGHSYVLVGRMLVSPYGCGSSGRADGSYWIAVDMNTGHASITENSTAPETTEDTAYLPLYRIEDGEVAEDRRGPFCVQRWEA